MADLQAGYTIQTENGKKAVVKEKIGEGGQGTVYRVDYGGQDKALKWYSGRKLKAPEKFYANLHNNIKKGTPAPAFLWPQDLTKHEGTAFGYIMDLRPSDYKDFSRFLRGKESFASITAMTNAALHITAAFRELHLKGYSYQDLNDGNFFINPKTGGVLICDNDNVSPHGENSGIAGKARYMAPEIVAKGAKPSVETDLFSLTVVLFLLWTNNHPLEGKAATPVCMDAKHEKKIYGEAPLFIFDPGDKSNVPVQGLHTGAIKRWPLLPAYLQEKFVQAFSQDVLKKPENRIIERDWLRLFIRMRSEVYKCSCGTVYFADPVAQNACPSCRTKNTFSYIKTHRYNLPLHQRTKLYACHSEKDSDDYETLTGEVSAKDGNFELKNLSGKSWTQAAEGIAPNGSVVLKKGMEISFGEGKAEII
ncbi:MAG: hypothetical protein FWG66_14965 [Spirochaetes bacterium]|nr:hypothetical protein [Spirochaetota bacterium]